MNLLAPPIIGKIEPPAGPPVAGDNPSVFIAGLVRGGIQLLLIVSFVVVLLWTIFAGFRFITSGGDPKSTGQAWTQMYMGLVGMLIIFGSFAIIKLVETFFEVSIISGGLILPTR